MDLGLKDKIAFITGASAGIGLSTAEAFVNEGAKVIICGRNQQKLDEAKKQIKKNTGADVSSYTCDTSKFDQVEKTVNEIVKEYKKIDIALDTFPYNGVTTSFEAIWMGVPVITMAGYNFNSRCGVSINKNLGMEQLIAKDENDYVQKAINFANDKEKYINLRKSIFTNAIKSPLFNAKRFAENFYDALRKIIK